MGAYNDGKMRREKDGVTEVVPLFFPQNSPQFLPQVRKEGSSISPVSYRVAGGCYQHSREVGRLPESAAAAARSGLPEEQQSHLLVRSSPPPLWSAASSHLASSSHSFSFTQSPFSPPIPPLPSRSSVIALSHSGWLHFFFSAPLALFLSPSFLLLQLIPNNKDFIFGPSSKPKSL